MNIPLRTHRFPPTTGRVCKRDGRRLANHHPIPDDDLNDLATWHKLIIYAGEESDRHDTPSYLQLICRLREARRPAARPACA